MRAHRACVSHIACMHECMHASIHASMQACSLRSLSHLFWARRLPSQRGGRLRGSGGTKSSSCSGAFFEGVDGAGRQVRQRSADGCGALWKLACHGLVGWLAVKLLIGLCTWWLFVVGRSWLRLQSMLGGASRADVTVTQHAMAHTVGTQGTPGGQLLSAFDNLDGQAVVCPQQLKPLHTITCQRCNDMGWLGC